MVQELKDNKIKINLGCGENKKLGYINLDSNPTVKPDITHDLNVFPYPFSDNSIEEIQAFHILEHLDSPFSAMAEFHRILKNGGRLLIKVPHFSRGMTHAQHAHGFDITFPLYFNPNFTKSGYTGSDFILERLTLRWLAFFHLLKYIKFSRPTIILLKFLNTIISGLANLSPGFCSRIWCFWVGGFDEIEFHFTCKK